jgi:hypothetical protein
MRDRSFLLFIIFPTTDLIVIKDAIKRVPSFETLASPSLVFGHQMYIPNELFKDKTLGSKILKLSNLSPCSVTG